MKPTHFNLMGGAYCVPRTNEAEFFKDYIKYVFGDTKGKLALTESPLVSSSGVTFSSVFIDFDLKYPVNSRHG